MQGFEERHQGRFSEVRKKAAEVAALTCDV
jgi:hypothetical protein